MKEHNKRTLCVLMSIATSNCFHQGDLNGRPCEASVDCTENLTCRSGVCTPDSEQPSDQPCATDGPCGASDGEDCNGECSCTYSVVSHQCPLYTYGTNEGTGGGKVFEICGNIDRITGAMTIDARRFDGGPFEDRPYQVRVSGIDEDCGPTTHYFKRSSLDPVGESTPHLRFEFMGEWEPGDEVKDYCVTASKQAGDPDYDPTNSQHQSWWWSDKLRVARACPQ